MNAPHGHDDARAQTGAEDELGFALPPPARVSSGKMLAIAGVIAAVIAVAFVVGYLPRREQQQRLVGQGTESTVTRLQVVTPKVGASDRAIVLPGSVQPLQETVLYARASGYVRKWYADIGDKVKEGQVLAELETPELEQELAQGRAQLAQAQAALVQANANAHLAKANLARYEQLAPSGVVSQAELDQNRAQAEVGDANVAVAKANLAAQDANLKRLDQLRAFAKVVAPYAGTITQRTAEIGGLVTAGTGQPLFKLAAMDPARVFIQTPQDVAPGVRAGVVAQVHVREFPTRTFDGIVARASNELDAATRTMSTEIRVPNPDGALISGMYTEVSLTLPSSHRVLEIPATALMTDAHGQRVAVIDSQSKLHLVPVVVERDDGATVEISSGLHGDEHVAKIGAASFVEGMNVEVAEDAKPTPS